MSNVFGRPGAPGARVTGMAPGNRPLPPNSGGTPSSGGGFGGGGGFSLPLPEADVAFDPAGGHFHDGGGSAVIPLSGDLSGDTGAGATVIQIQGQPIPAPAGGNDGQVVFWNNGAGRFDYKS